MFIIRFAQVMSELHLQVYTCAIFLAGFGPLAEKLPQPGRNFGGRRVLLSSDSPVGARSPNAEDPQAAVPGSTVHIHPFRTEWGRQIRSKCIYFLSKD